jgi:hypothetical protein
MRCASTSVSVSERNSTPSASSRARRAPAFSMIPLWTTATVPVASTCGWALTSLGTPWVAHRVWAMPAGPATRLGMSAARSRTLPWALWTRRAPFLATATPAES